MNHRALPSLCANPAPSLLLIKNPRGPVATAGYSIDVQARSGSAPVWSILDIGYRLKWLVDGFTPGVRNLLELSLGLREFN
ncbi:hypothetical protein PoB_004180900 [Plakobranchus ocellatus]|uniref:Uncharacterized protein n=1 Tax=Plakobranchus ocellatus TaxID=259542 RepID=A0AAV4B5B8_9GAST|nr:hypothetical protein PoB_004180900 [Plakobranchus ocellatus]